MYIFPIARKSPLVAGFSVSGKRSVSADALSQGGDARRVFFQRFGADRAHFSAFAVDVERTTVVCVQMRIERRVAQFGIGECHCQQMLFDGVAGRVKSWRMFETANHGRAGAFDVRMRGAVSGWKRASE